MTVDEKDVEVEVDPRIGTRVPAVHAGQGAESIQFEGSDVVYAVEDDVIVGTVDAVAEAKAEDDLGTKD